MVSIRPLITRKLFFLTSFATRRGFEHSPSLGKKRPTQAILPSFFLKRQGTAEESSRKCHTAVVFFLKLQCFVNFRVFELLYACLANWRLCLAPTTFKLAVLPDVLFRKSPKMLRKGHFVFR